MNRVLTGLFPQLLSNRIVNETSTQLDTCIIMHHMVIAIKTLKDLHVDIDDKLLTIIMQLQMYM